VTKIILTDEITARQKYHELKYQGLQELADFIVKRVQGKVGDILLPDEARVEGLIRNYIEQMEVRMKGVKCPNFDSL